MTTALSEAKLWRIKGFKPPIVSKATILYAAGTETVFVSTFWWIKIFKTHYNTHIWTSNVTSVTEVRSASACLFAGTWRPWLVLLQHSIILQRLFFIIECGIAHFLCAMPVFEVRASSSYPRLPLCAKFRFFRGLHGWARPRRRNRVLNHSITQSLTQLIWCPGKYFNVKFIKFSGGNAQNLHNAIHNRSTLKSLTSSLKNLLLIFDFVLSNLLLVTYRSRVQFTSHLSLRAKF